MPIHHKIKILNELKGGCLKKSKLYKKRYKKLKKIDDITDFTTSILNASSISLIVSSVSMPLLVIPSAVCSSIQFVIGQVQNKVNLKNRYNRHLTTSYQYEQLAREILIVLSKNHLTNDQYEAYIQEVNDKIGLIQDSEIL
jgi:hypothetical protein